MTSFKNYIRNEMPDNNCKTNSSNYLNSSSKFINGNSIGQNGSQEELSFGDFTREELNTFFNKQITNNSQKNAPSKKSGASNSLSSGNSTDSWNILKKKHQDSPELESDNNNLYRINSSYFSKTSSPHSSPSSSESASIKSVSKEFQGMDSNPDKELNINSDKKTLDNNHKNVTNDTPRRNKRRKPPSYYQSAEYAAILKDADTGSLISNSANTNVSVSNNDEKSVNHNNISDMKTSNQLNELTLKTDSLNLNDTTKSGEKSNAYKNVENVQPEPSKMVWGKPINSTVQEEKIQLESDNTDNTEMETKNKEVNDSDRNPISVQNDNPTLENSNSNLTDSDNKQTKLEEKETSSKSITESKEPISWATLFKNNPNINEQKPAQSTQVKKNVKTVLASSSSLPINYSTNLNGVYSGNISLQPEVQDQSTIESLKTLGQIFKQCELKHSAPALQPRGIRNKQNWCYINATLQALLACPPFYNLIKSIYQKIKGSNQNMKSVPCLTAIGRYIAEFKTMVRVQNDPKSNLVLGEPFEINYFYDTLRSLKTELTFKSGRQEDAQEFLSFLLNKLHDEMVKCLDSLSSNTNNQKETASNNDLSIMNSNLEETDNSDWNVVGKKNRAQITRKAEFKQSPLSDIFCGQFRSALSQPGSREKDSLSLEPFFTLPLDIQPDNVRNVQQALEYFVQKEEVFGYTNQETKQEIEAFKRMSFEDLPPVLILYLKCFVYDKQGGIQKLLKRIEFQIDLEINKELIAPNQRSKFREKKRTYKLFAVEYHHGDRATGGHYITDVYHPGIIGWVRYDDSKVRVVNNSHVLKSDDKKLVPYLLYYRRADYI